MGTLQGVSQVNSIKSQLNRLLISMDSEGRSLTAYGLNVSDDGLFSFNASKLTQKLNEDPDDVESFFKGISSTDALSYYAKDPIQAGAINLQYGDFKLNGFSFVFSTEDSNSAEDNLIAFKDRINQYTSEHGVVASLDPNGTHIVLKSSDGTDIKIEGNASKLAQLGVESTDLKSTITSNVGIFSSLSETLDNMLKESTGSITLLDNQYTSEQKRLTLERSRTMEQLDNKYATMVAQFAAYDTIIANLNNQFSSLQSMIDTQLNSN
jgi:flagellar hook-associated protein 2